MGPDRSWEARLGLLYSLFQGWTESPLPCLASRESASLGNLLRLTGCGSYAPSSMAGLHNTGEALGSLGRKLPFPL